VTTDVPTSEQNRNGFVASAFCPSPMLATGGGFAFQGGGILVKASRPIGTTPTGWQAVFAYGPDVPNPPPASAEVTVFLSCVRSRLKRLQIILGAHERALSPCSLRATVQ
jgi:hypothetical protein